MRALLLLSVLIFLLAKTEAYIEEPGPRVIATKGIYIYIYKIRLFQGYVDSYNFKFLGAIWPKPKEQKSEETFSIIKLAQLKFQVPIFYI